MIGKHLEIKNINRKKKIKKAKFEFQQKALQPWSNTKQHVKNNFVQHLFVFFQILVSTYLVKTLHNDTSINYHKKVCNLLSNVSVANKDLKEQCTSRSKAI